MSTDAYTVAADRAVEVLLAGSDPEYLERIADRVTEDGIHVHSVATTDPEAAIARLDEGEVDCLIATYNPSANDGLPILDYLRDETVEVPVILLPSGPTTVVVSENLVVDVASVFTRQEAVDGEGFGPDAVVDAVEERQATEAAKRRRALEEAIESVARELSAAERREEIDRSLVEGMADTDEVDAAWMAEVDGDEVAVREGVADGTEARPPRDGPAGEAVKRALAVEQPQVTHRDGANYAAVPVSPENDESGVLTMASESRYAFSDEETRVLRDVGDTASRAIDDVARTQVGPAGGGGQAAFETVLERLSVPVVAYGDAGWVAGANDAFAEMVGQTREAVVGQPVWEVLPAPRLDTFEDYWASFSPGETRTQLVEFDRLPNPHQLVTTRVGVGEDQYNVSLAVEQVEESADPWFADVLAYEFRHWLAIAEDAMDGAAPGEDDSETVEAVVDRMQDAMASEVQAARAGAAGGEELVLEEPAGADAAGAGDAVDAAGAGGPADAAGGGAGPADAEAGSAGADAAGGGADRAAAEAGTEPDDLDLELEVELESADDPAEAGADAGGAEASGAEAGGAGAGSAGSGGAGPGSTGAGSAGSGGAGPGSAGAGSAGSGSAEVGGAGAGGGGSDGAGPGSAGAGAPGRAEPDAAADVEAAEDAIDFGEADDVTIDESQLADAAERARNAEGAVEELALEPQPVSGVARDAWMTVVGEFGEYEIRGERKVLADDTLLHRLFAHLFRTLFSYGNASGVDVGVEDGRFFVEDDGAGVPHHRREYADAETMTDAKSGAGIQVARRLARRHGWTLSIEATDEGGSRFVVSGANVLED